MLISKKTNKKNTISMALASLLMLSQGLIAVRNASARVVDRAHGRCSLTVGQQKIFDGHCVMKYKESNGQQVVVINLDNGKKYKLRGPNLDSLQIEAWDGIHNVNHRVREDKEVFVWNVDGERNRLVTKMDTKQEAEASVDDSSSAVAGVLIGTVVGGLIGSLISGNSSSSNSENSSSNNSNPYAGKSYYNATAYFKCSVGNDRHDKSCPGGIRREGNGKASVTVKYPNGYEVQYNFNRGDVTTTFDGKLTWAKQGDEWYLGIDNNLFIIIPDAAVYGG